MSQECNQLAVTEEIPCGVQIAFQGWSWLVGEPGRLRRERGRQGETDRQLGKGGRREAGRGRRRGRRRGQQAGRGDRQVGEGDR